MTSPNTTLSKAAGVLLEYADLIAETETHFAGPLVGKMDPEIQAEVDEYRALAAALEALRSEKLPTVRHQSCHEQCQRAVAMLSEHPLQEHYDRLAEEVSRLQNLINTPEMEDFLQGTKIEAAHQVERWGDAHDRSKSAENWYWLVGYLAGKALRASIAGERDKALHHTISSAAALFQWHKAIARDTSSAGLGNDQDLKPDEVKR